MFMHFLYLLNTRLGAGWSVHTNKFASFSRGGQLSADEQDQIMRVIKKAEMLEHVEMQRIGYVVVILIIFYFKGGEGWRR